MNDNVYINSGTHNGDVVQIQQTNTEYVYYDDTPSMSSADQIKLVSTIVGAGLAVAAGVGVVVLGVVALPVVAVGGAVALAWRFRGELADVAAVLTLPIWFPVKLLSDAITTRNARKHELKAIEAARPIVIVVSNQQDAYRLLETHSGAKLLTDRSTTVIEMPSTRHADRLGVRNGYTK